jgi:ABC-type transporter Mla subunit MlaD
MVVGPSGWRLSAGWRALGALLIALGSVSLACGRAQTRTAYVVLPVAENVKEGAPVKFRGIDIGVVQKIWLQRSGIRAQLVIRRPDAPLQANDRVVVRAVGVFGDQAIVIIPASTDGPPLRDGDTLHAAPPDSLAPTGAALTRAVQEFTRRLGIPDSALHRR